MRAPRPTVARVVATVRFGRSFRKVCRGGIYPAREPPRRNRHPRFRAAPKIHPEQAPLSKGAGCGQSPQTGGLPRPQMQPSGAPPKRALPSVNGISRRSNPSVLASLGHLPLTREVKTAPTAANRADMESAPTRVCHNAWPRPSRPPQSIKFIRRGGIYPARERLHHRGVRRGEGTPPYGRPGGCGRPVWPVVSESL